MHEGSLRGSIFALLASAMGTGLFNLPERTREIGIIPFAVFVFLGGLFSMIGMVYIVRLIAQCKFKSYGEMSMAAYGTPLKRFSEVCIIIYPWGITICFQVIFASFICQLLHDALGQNLYDDRAKEQLNSTGNLVRISVNLGCLLLTSIFALKRNISILQKIAIIGVVSVIFNVVIVVIISLTGFKRSNQMDPDGPPVVYHGIFHVDGSKINWFSTDGLASASLICQGMASILFCYVNHQMLFPLSLSLKRPSQSRLLKIINRVHVVELLVYSMVAIPAYLLLLEHIEQYKIAAVVIGSIPITVVTVGKVLMLAALFFAVPLNMFPARESFFDATLIAKTNRNHIIVTMSLMCSSTAIAIGFVKVNSYFGLLGGTAGVMMAGGIPGLCYFKLREKLTKVDIATLVLCLIITVIASVGAVLSIFDAPS